MLQGGEGCEGADDIIGEVDAVVGPVVSGGEITGESDRSAVREPEQPKKLMWLRGAQGTSLTEGGRTQ